MAAEPFWNDEELPFELHGGGAVCRIVPDRGFRKTALAGTEDERHLVVDCPDADGWLVPQALVGQWMAKNIRNDALDDVLLSHPLYEHLTRTDSGGHSRSGGTPFVYWTPGVATHAGLRAPEFLPEDDEAPRINRDRRLHAEGVVDLLERLAAAFPLEELEVGFSFEPPSGPVRRARPATKRNVPLH